MLFSRGYSNGKYINEVLKRRTAFFTQKKTDKYAKPPLLISTKYDPCLQKIVKTLEVTELRWRMQRSFSTETGNISYKTKIKMISWHDQNPGIRPRFYKPSRKYIVNLCHPFFFDFCLSIDFFKTAKTIVSGTSNKWGS